MSQGSRNNPRKDRDRLFLSKVIVVGFLLLVQIAFLITATILLGKYYVYVQIGCTVISLLVTFYIINRQDNPAYKLTWVVPILLFPIFGGIFYLIVAGNQSSKRFVRKVEKSIRRIIEEEKP